MQSETWLDIEPFLYYTKQEANKILGVEDLVLYCYYSYFTRICLEEIGNVFGGKFIFNELRPKTLRNRYRSGLITVMNSSQR